MMKRLLIISFCLLACLDTFGTQMSIYFHDILAESDFDKRSVSVLPTGFYDGKSIYIYSSIFIENIEVTVKDGNGDIVYSDVTRIPAGQSYSFALDAVTGEEYTIELAYGDRFLYGNFEL